MRNLFQHQLQSVAASLRDIPASASSDESSLAVESPIVLNNTTEGLLRILPVRDGVWLLYRGHLLFSSLKRDVVTHRVSIRSEPPVSTDDTSGSSRMSYLNYKPDDTSSDAQETSIGPLVGVALHPLTCELVLLQSDGESYTLG